MEELKAEAIALLKQLISIPSFSKEEVGTADVISNFLTKKGIVPQRQGNNVWAFLTPFEEQRPTIGLNTHHDTVKPNT